MTRKRVSYATWTRAELIIGKYLAQWAHARDWPRRSAAWRNTIARFDGELATRDRRFLDAWLSCQPLPKTERGYRTTALTHLLQRIIATQPF